MVFSFFKKDQKEPKKGGSARPSPAGPRTGGATDVTTRPAAKPIGRPLSGPVNRSLDRPSAPTTAFPLTETALPERERARNRARETAAKIDAIESEMARDLMRGLGRSVGAPTTTSAAPAKPPAANAGGPQSRPLNPVADETAESATDIFGGNIDAIEINTSGAGSVIDETAILFSNGQADEAEAVLRAGLRGADLGAATRLAWQMLFELLNQRGDKAAFEQLTMEYALRFEHSPPPWIDYVATPVARPAVKAAPVATPTPSGAPCVRLPEQVGADIVGHLEQLRSLTAAHAAVQLDVSDVRRVDVAGADLMQRVIKAFKRSQRELTLVGAAQFADALSRCIESGRRDPSDAVWMLLLEVQRVLGRQEEFEETAIQYCITFEVSPPSWEPPSANLKGADASPPAVAAAVVAAGPAASPFELSGVIDGEGEPHFRHDRRRDSRRRGIGPLQVGRWRFP